MEANIPRSTCGSKKPWRRKIAFLKFTTVMNTGLRITSLKPTAPECWLPHSYCHLGNQISRKPKLYFSCWTQFCVLSRSLSLRARLRDLALRENSTITWPIEAHVLISTHLAERWPFQGQENPEHPDNIQGHQTPSCSSTAKYAIFLPEMVKITSGSKYCLKWEVSKEGNMARF